MRVLLSLALISAVFSAKFPKEITRCHKSDPNFNECLKSSMDHAIKWFQNGYKPLGLPVLDPLSIPELTTEVAGLHQTFKNVLVTGICGSTFKKIECDWDKLEMKLESVTAHSDVTADYTFKGKLLTFPLDSSGKFKVSCDDVTSIIHAKLERYQKNGKNHLKWTSWKIRNIPKAVRYEIDNLMPDNEQLSKTILDTMNENALDVFKELGVGFDEAYGEVQRALANSVFDRIPEDELILP